MERIGGLSIARSVPIPNDLGGQQLGIHIRAMKDVTDQSGARLGSLMLYAVAPMQYRRTVAVFSDLSRPLTLELRIVQNYTGLKEQVRKEGCSDDVTVQMSHTAGALPHAEVVVFDEDGNQIAVVRTDSC